MEALAPLRVVDFSRILAGPFATMMLADLGADVTKVERPGSGDDTRTWGPPFDDAGRRRPTSRRSTATSAASPRPRATRPTATRAARARARRRRRRRELPPGRMERLGLDYEAVRATNPGLVYCSITGFGSGAGAALPGYDLLVQALGGLMSITGEPEGEPQKVGVALVDVLAGPLRDASASSPRFATATAPARASSWRSTCSPRCSRRSSTRRAPYTHRRGPGRMGNAHPSIAPYELFRPADRELVLAVGNDAQFARLCATLGAPGSRPTSALRPTRRGLPRGSSCADCWRPGWRPSRPPNGSRS